MSRKDHRPSWLEKIKYFLLGAPTNRSELLKTIHYAEQQRILNSDTLIMIEGVLQITQMQARDIMIPRSQMIVLKKQATLNEILPILNQNEHSRYPVIDEEKEDVVGILFAKDLLGVTIEAQKTFVLRQLMRPPIFIPESKRLNVLLREFRDTRTHMAIVVDEYGNTAGLITLEDVLEQIVGEIEDEHDVDDENNIKAHAENHYILKAATTLVEFNTVFSKALEDPDCDTIGGYITKFIGYVPKRGESIIIDHYEFKILHANKRRINVLELKFTATGIVTPNV